MPLGCTSPVQPVDLAVNKPFKNALKNKFERHLDENLDNYVEVKLAVSDRIVLTTKWVGNPWKKVCQSKDMIIRSFKNVKRTRGGGGGVDWRSVNFNNNP